MPTAIPIAFIFCTKRKIFPLAMTFILSSCAMVSGESNRVSESDIDKDKKMYTDLVASQNEAKIIIVHRYIKRCCGANPSVEINGEQVPRRIWKSSLAPLDDFVCWQAKPGEVRLIAELKDKATAEYRLNLENGETIFLAVDSDLRRKSYKLSFQVVSETIGLHHLHKTLDRVRDIASEGHYKDDPYGPLAIRAAESVKEKLQCMPANYM